MINTFQTVEDLSLWILGYVVIISRGWMAHNSMHFFAHFFLKSKVTESIYVYPTKKVDGSSPEPVNLGFSLLSIMQQCLPDANFKSTGIPKTSTDCKEC